MLGLESLRAIVLIISSGACVYQLHTATQLLIDRPIVDATENLVRLMKSIILQNRLLSGELELVLSQTE